MPPMKRGKRSEYAPKFEAIVREAGRTGVSISELIEQTGCAPQTAHSWKHQQLAAGMIEETGKMSAAQSMQYRWITGPRYPNAIDMTGREVNGNGNGNGHTSNDLAHVSLEPGQQYTMMRVDAIVDGRVYAVFEDVDGHQFRVSIDLR